MLRRRFSWMTVFAFLLLASRVSPQPFQEKNLPPELRGWAAWVLAEVPDHACTLSSGHAICTWPGRLALSASTSGGSFSFDVLAEKDLSVELPGGAEVWPGEVKVDGKAVPVVSVVQSSGPAVWLSSGRHHVEGKLVWRDRPETLSIPLSIGLVDLTLDGRPVSIPQREENGLLVLGKGKEHEAGADTERIEVFRKISDGNPPWLETRIVVEAAGKAREVSLTGAVIPGSIPARVAGEIPARLDPAGTLHVQLRAGTFTLTVLSRLPAAAPKIGRAPGEINWPKNEYWVFAADEKLRRVEISGAPSVEPARTAIPVDWRAFPAFVLDSGGSLTLEETRRGEPAAPPDQLHLSRELWLDEGGGRFTFRDRMSGELHRTMRLEIQNPGALGRASVNGEDQLLTVSAKGSGVELRQTLLRFEADGRIPDSSSGIPAVGWNVGMQSLGAVVNLPPGWRLLGGRGVDQIPGSWASSWTLFAFFFVLLVSLAVLKLTNRSWGAFALVTLVACHGESGAPQLVWLVLALGAALLTILPPGRLRTSVRLAFAVAAISWVFICVPFLAGQIRTAIFPQTESPRIAAQGLGNSEANDKLRALGYLGARAGGGGEKEKRVARVEGKMSQDAPRPVESPALEPQSPAQLDSVVTNAYAFSSNGSESGVTSGGDVARKRAPELAQDPNAVIQTGDGVPDWQWSRYGLVWNGPVAPEHRMKLYFLSPLGGFFLSLIRVVFIVVLGARLVWLGWFAPVRPNSGSGGATATPSPSVSTVAALLILAAGSTVFLSFAPVAFADGDGGELETGSGTPRSPSSKILGDLRSRLTRRPPCEPHCISASSARLTITGDQLIVTTEIHAAAAGAWTVPGPAGSWIPGSVLIDGQPSGVVRIADGFLLVRVPEGIHTVTVSGAVPSKDSFTLQWKELPHRASASASGWQVDGIHENGTLDGSLQLSRKLPAGGAGKGEERNYEPWFVVTRTFDFGVSWNILTTAARVTPAGAPAILKVSQPKGSILTDARFQLIDGEVVVPFGRDETSVSFASTLKPEEGARFELEAASGRPWSEVWVVRPGLSWQADIEGPTPVSRESQGRFSTEIRPWPGEKMSMILHRGQGAPGQAVTIDSVTMTSSPGKRLEETILDVVIRASRRDRVRLTLPEGAELQHLQVDGIESSARPDHGVLEVPVDAGRHVAHVSWQQVGGFALRQKLPVVTFGQSAVNVRLSLLVPPDRWLLMAGGPRWGPAVLFWGYLICLLIVGGLLGRIPGSPLRSREWVLLSLGLGQLSMFSAAMVAGWFFLVRFRRQQSAWKAATHDLFQLLFAAWTTVALSALYRAVKLGLILRPDMQVSGNGSSDTNLHWYAGRIAASTPSASVLSAPLWFYHLLILAWSLWLAANLLRWLREAWESFSSGGIWKSLEFGAGIEKLRRRPLGQHHNAAGAASTEGPLSEPANRAESQPPESLVEREGWDLKPPDSAP